jgi:hypothetical protein
VDFGRILAAIVVIGGKILYKKEEGGPEVLAAPLTDIAERGLFRGFAADRRLLHALYGTGRGRSVCDGSY